MLYKNTHKKTICITIFKKTTLKKGFLRIKIKTIKIPENIFQSSQS